MSEERFQNLRALDIKSGPGDASPIADESVTCRHHWLIETPEGPTSRGICRLCGEERVFENDFENYSGNNNGQGFRATQTNVRQLQEV